MFVEKLAVFGFKSFNQSLELAFGPGISGVLGPNGCGKSNLVDAFRWVMGEQSSKTLRGDRMEDVIFNGTKDLKPLAMAEVSLTLSNTRGILPVEYDQVTIGRRLYRSGQSEYSINRTPCRLKDVRDLFLDTGMGSHAYSVIERGMVDNVLSDTTGHRRFLFEEASGIMKYKTRRKEAQTKLEATQGDLVRLFDILREVERETDSLKRQVGKARRYRDLRDRLKGVDLAALQARLRDLSVRLAGLAESGESLSREEASSRARLSTAEARLEELRLQAVTAERALVSAREELAGLDASITDANHQIVVLREREASTRQRMDDARERIERLAARRLENDEEAVRAGEALERHAAGREEEKERLAVREAGLAGLDAELRARREHVGRKKQLSLDLFQERMKREGDLRHCRSELEQIENARRELEEERSGLVARRLEASQRRDEARERMAAIGRRIEEKAVEAAALNERIVLLEERVRDGSEEEAALRRQVAGVESSLETLRALRSSYEGFDAGVRHVMLAHGREPAVLGTVADLIHAPVEWVEALRPVLGGVMQQVVTRDVATARGLIDDLATAGAGHATFLPLDRLPEPETRFLPHHPAVIARAKNLVQAPPEVRPLVDHLLGDVLLVNDLDQALEMAADPAWRSHRFVTPDGGLVAGSVMAGGRGGDAAGDLMAREKEIDTLVGRLEELAGQVRTSERARQEAEGERILAHEELERVRADAAALAAERAARETEAGRLEGELLVIEEREADLVLRESGFATRQQALAGELEQMAGVLETVSQDSRAAESTWREEEEALAALETRREAAQAALSESRVAMATLDAALSETGERIERVRATAREIEAERGRSDAELSEGEERLLRLAADIDGLACRVQELHGGREARVEAVVERERVTTDLGGELSAAEAAAREARRAAGELREQAHGREIQVTELRGEWKALEARLYEEYEMGADRLLEMGLEWPAGPDGAALELEAVDALVAELKDKIKHLGPVNLLAIEEYEEKSGRLTFLRGQYDDLVQARESLTRAISQINTTAANLFSETFVKVQANFQKTFQVLFQGGECQLTLLGDDPLEAEIEIVARPRGKRPQSIAQLSSGERALTAIALLFAIYLVKPSPFCLLDEVDAPLDDANVDRFVAMLREFSGQTQFIVITHNKKTMEAADTLYGVTMPTPGISQVVSVRLSEAEAVRDGKPAPAVERTGAGSGGNGHGNGDEPEVEPLPPVTDAVIQ